MTKFRYLSFPLVVLFVFFLVFPALAHLPPECVPPHDGHNKPPHDGHHKPPPSEKPPPVPKPPPSEKPPPVPKSPPPSPVPKSPPPSPVPKSPPPSPVPKSPPPSPVPKSPPPSPVPKSPPPSPVPKSPPPSPVPKSPPPPVPSSPPNDPKPKPPPNDPKPKPPPIQTPPPSEPTPKPPPSQPTPPEDPKIVPPHEPPEEPQKPTTFHARFKGRFTALFAFGDSYTDTGNAKYLGSLVLSFMGSLSSPYASNRLSDGRLVIDFITDSLGLPVLPPYQSTSSNFTNGVNFAIAGSTTLARDLLSKLARVFLQKGTPLGVWTQLDWYKKYQTEHLCKGLDEKACSDKLKTALFWVGEIGLNDYSRAVGSTIPLRAIAKSSVAYVTELVKVLIKAGAKNIVVQGLPPVGCLPMDISLTPISIRDRSGCSTIVNAAVVVHNEILKAKLEIYRKMHPDVTIIYADSWKAYYAIVNNPQKYKITETHKTCCGASGPQNDMNFNLESLCGSSGTSICDDPSQYISWDGIHPTESMNEHMTDQYINHGCCQPPFEELMKNNVPK
ncbi:GDSL esterase/lipase-like protein [Tanacetum coccineum]